MSSAGPFVDWAEDPDVVQPGKNSDEQAIKNGWSDAKAIFSFEVVDPVLL